MKILRVVTSVYAVKAHLSPILNSYPNSDVIYIVGNNVSSLKKEFPNIFFIDIPIERNPSILLDLVAFARLFQVFRKVNPDVCHSLMTKSGLMCSIIGFLLRTPVRIHTFTGQVWSLMEKKSLKRKALKCVDQIICLLNSACFTDSPSQSTFLKKEGITLKGKAVPWFGAGSLNGVDEARFLSLKPKTYSDLGFMNDIKPEGVFICAYVARKSFDKGFYDFLITAKRLISISDRYRFIFCGPDESGGNLKKLLLEFNFSPSFFLNIDFSDDYLEYLMVSQLLIMPSYREGFGSIVIDAGFLGVPTVAYKIDGIIDAVKNGDTGLLVDVGCIDEIVKAVEFLRLNEEDYQIMSLNAELRVKNEFNSQKIFSEYYDFLCQSLGQR